MADGEPDIAAQEAEIRKLLTAAHEHMVARDDMEALVAYGAVAEAALNLLVARVDSGEPPSSMTDDDRAVWGLFVRSSIEFEHGNQQLGAWFRDSARRRALERYEQF